MKISGKFVLLKKMNLNDADFIYNLIKKKDISLYLHNPPKSLSFQKKWMMNNIKDKVKNDIDASKHTRKKNLLTALDKAFDELNTSTDWTAVKPQEASYSCCSSCIFGSPQFDDRENAITYNDQDLQGFRWSYKECFYYMKKQWAVASGQGSLYNNDIIKHVKET